MIELGDFAVGATVQFKWNAFSGLGGSITRATNGSILVYKGSSVTQRTSAAGITDTEDFDSLTGLNHVTIDLADNTDAGFYAAASEYQVVLQGAVIDGQTVNAVIAHFSIERAGGLAAILARLPAALVSGRIDASVGAMASGVLTATAIAADAITDAKVASDVTIASVTGAVGSVATGGITTASFAAGAINAAAIAADAIGASELAADAANKIADALLDRTAGVETNRTPRQALRLMLAALAGKASGLATTTAVYRDTNDGVDRITATVDADGNRSSVTLDAS